MTFVTFLCQLARFILFFGSLNPTFRARLSMISGRDLSGDVVGKGGLGKIFRGLTLASNCGILPGVVNDNPVFLVSVAQWIERLVADQKVAGSNPAGDAWSIILGSAL